MRLLWCLSTLPGKKLERQASASAALVHQRSRSGWYEKYEKTALCTMFALGRCQNASNRTFAHSRQELRRLAPLDLSSYDRSLLGVVRHVQGHSREYSKRWNDFCDQYCWGTKDPKAHSDKVLRRFIDSLAL